MVLSLRSAVLVLPAASALSSLRLQLLGAARDMRYRYRYQYYGPKYRYYPAWGYPRPGHNIAADSHWHWDR